MNDRERIAKLQQDVDWLAARLDWVITQFGHHAQLDRIEAKLGQVLIKENKIMALGQDILDAVTAETTVIDSFIALVQGLIADNTIPAATGTAILAAINANKDKVAAAIIANTPPTP